jgi:hypothetical protein
MSVRKIRKIKLHAKISCFTVESRCFWCWSQLPIIDHYFFHSKNLVLKFKNQQQLLLCNIKHNFIYLENKSRMSSMWWNRNEKKNPIFSKTFSEVGMVWYIYAYSWLFLGSPKVLPSNQSIRYLPTPFRAGIRPVSPQGHPPTSPVICGRISSHVSITKLC